MNTTYNTKLAQNTIKYHKAYIDLRSRIVLILEVGLAHDLVDYVVDIYDLESMYDNLTGVDVIKRYIADSREYIAQLESEHLIPADIDFEGYSYMLANSPAEAVQKIMELNDKWDSLFSKAKFQTIVERKVMDIQYKRSNDLLIARTQREMLDKFNAILEEKRAQDKKEQEQENDFFNNLEKEMAGFNIEEGN